MTEPADSFATTFINKGGAMLNGRPHSDYTKEEIDAYWAAHRAAQDQHALCRKQPVSRMSCEPCRERKIRWMLMQPRTGHVYRNGVRLAEVYGVK